MFAERLNVSAAILALAAVPLVGAEEVSSIFYGHKSFRIYRNLCFLSMLLSLLSPIA